MARHYLEHFYPKIAKVTDFTTKHQAMSTLEQLLEMGRKEGIEKGLDRGVLKQRVFHLLKTAIKFPQLSEVELADFTELSLETVLTFRDKVNSGDTDELLSYIRVELLGSIPLRGVDEANLSKMVEQLMQQ